MSETSRKTKGKPSSVDIHVGKRLRMRRTILGITQEKLADALGVTFQQVQKYERGTNRVSAGKLYELSKVLETSISYFYEGMGKSANILGGLSDNQQDGFESEDIMQKKETLDLVRIYYSVEDPKKRKELLNIVKSMADNLS